MENEAKDVNKKASGRPSMPWMSSPPDGAHFYMSRKL
jgi:hypothetical protein